MIRLVYEIDRRDKETLDFFVKELLEARGIKPAPAATGDEARYWAMVQRMRAAGAQPYQVARSLGTFTLPEGVEPW